MCGKEIGKGIRIRVDKAVLVVGPECTRFGVVLETPTRAEAAKRRPQPTVSTNPERAQPQKTPRPPSRETDPLERTGGELVLDYPRRIQQARTVHGLKQDELAAKLNEKKSVIRELESGALIPNDALVRKLEKQLKITLTENVSHEYKLPSVKRREMTLGDIVKE